MFNKVLNVLKTIDNAEKEFKAALLLNINLSVTHNFLGVIYNGTKYYENALKSFERAVTIAPDYASAHKNLGLIYLNYKNNKIKALFHLNETLRLAPEQKQAGDFKNLIESLK